MTAKAPADVKKALRLRERVKGKKPQFVRPESWRYVRLKKSWRKPKGLDHKVRIQYKGWPAGVNVGYRGPRIARGLHPSGFREVLVYNVDDLINVDPRTHAIRIAHTVGKRKRSRIITEARRKNLLIFNVKEIKEAKAKEEEEEKEAEEAKVKEEEAEKKTEEKVAAEEETEEKPEKTKKRKRRTKKQ
jgi:large subunit ribosomal protein L32e